jgi:hypothetical protein
MLELPQGLRLDLPDTLAGDAELLADFLQRMIRSHPDAKPHALYALFAEHRGRQTA